MRQGAVKFWKMQKIVWDELLVVKSMVRFQLCICLQHCFYAYFGFYFHLDAELPAELRQNETMTTTTAASDSLADKIIYPDPEIERDVYESPSFTNNPYAEPSAFQNREFMELLTNLQQQQQPGSGIGPNPNDIITQMMMSDDLFGGGARSAAKLNETTETKVTKLLKSKIHIGLLAILTYTFINLGYSCNVFLIFLIWEMVEMFILKQYENKSGGMLSIVFMLSGISPAKLNVFMKWFQIINRVLRDVAIFLFFFVVSHICCGGNVALDAITVPIKVENTISDEMYADEFEF